MSGSHFAGLPAPTALAVPTLQTERLILSAHRLEDFAECLALWADPEVTRHITGRPSTKEEVWARILRYVGHWALLGFGYWVVREKDSGRFVGEVGFADFMREVEPSLDGDPEAGWVLAPWAHGRGLATEAVRAIIAWAAQHLRSRRIVCMIAPDNVASVRVALKCGYKEFARTTYKGEPTILFSRALNE